MLTWLYTNGVDVLHHNNLCQSLYVLAEQSTDEDQMLCDHIKELLTAGVVLGERINLKRTLSILPLSSCELLLRACSSSKIWSSHYYVRDILQPAIASEDWDLLLLLFKYSDPFFTRQDHLLLAIRVCVDFYNWEFYTRLLALSAGTIDVETLMTGARERVTALERQVQLLAATGDPTEKVLRAAFACSLVERGASFLLTCLQSWSSFEDHPLVQFLARGDTEELKVLKVFLQHAGLPFPGRLCIVSPLRLGLHSVCRSLLRVAVAGTSVEVVQFLFQQGADLREEGLLTAACTKRPVCLPVLRLLLEHGLDPNALAADPNDLTISRTTNLAHAFQFNTPDSSCEAAILLLDYGANPNLHAFKCALSVAPPELIQRLVSGLPTQELLLMHPLHHVTSFRRIGRFVQYRIPPGCCVVLC